MRGAAARFRGGKKWGADGHPKSKGEEHCSSLNNVLHGRAKQSTGHIS
jgi:hypothetical protein